MSSSAAGAAPYNPMQTGPGLPQAPAGGPPQGPQQPPQGVNQRMAQMMAQRMGGGQQAPVGPPPLPQAPAGGMGNPQPQQGMGNPQPQAGGMGNPQQGVPMQRQMMRAQALRR